MEQNFINGLLVGLLIGVEVLELVLIASLM